jgi:hypothetical protein
MLLNKPASFPRICFFALFVLLNPIFRIQEHCFGYANSVHENEITRFIKDGVFDPDNISEDELYESIETAYSNETDPDRLNTLAKRLLTLKWWKLWDANAEMAAETVIVGDPLERYFRSSDNWQWEGEPHRSHYSVPVDGTARHSVNGIFPYILPANGTLVQEMYFSGDQVPEQVILRIETGYLVGHQQQQLVFVQARWTKHPEHRPATENRPDDFWAGMLPTPHPLTGMGFDNPVSSKTTDSPPGRGWGWVTRSGSASDSGTHPSPLPGGEFMALPCENPYLSAPHPSQEGNMEGGWYELSVNLVDLGLCGSNRIIRGIEYLVIGGNAWFGQTIIRRPQVEIRGTKKYNVFSIEDDVVFEITVHNFSRSEHHYTLHLTVSDYNGAEIMTSVYHLDIPGQASRRETLVLNPGTKRYFVFEYTLSEGEKAVYHGYSAAAVIAPNRTGRKDQTKFGMIYWDQPGKDMVELYEKLGVKLIVIFPEMHRLHLFDRQKFTTMPMIWALPDRSPQAAAKLAQDIRPYLEAGQHFFSNFWETDLRVPPDIFAPNMKRFNQIIKQLDPAALVGIGGLAWFNVAYVNQLLRFGNNTPSPDSFFDFIAMMLYNTPSPPEFSGIDQETAALTSLLKSYGKSETELWNVEWSYFENLNLDGGYWLNTGVPQDLVAPYTIRHHLLGFASGISRMVPGTNIYEGRTPLAKNYGHSMTLGRSSIIRYDLTPLPLLPAYSVMTRMLEGKEYVTTIGQHPNIICQVYRASDESYKLLSSSKTVLVVWTLLGVEHVALPLLGNTEDCELKVTLVNMVGDETEQSTYHGALHLSVSPEPTYILLNEDVAEILKRSAGVSAENILAASPKLIDVSPGKASTIKLTYHLFNPGWKALQGTIQLTQPNWIQVLTREIHYPDEMRRQLAETILSRQTSRPSDRMSADIWLGRNHRVDVTYEMLIPEEIKRKTYYEQIELTKQPSFLITAVFQSEGKVMAQATTLVRVLPPLSMTLRPVLSRKDDVNSPHLVVSITNNSPVDRQGTLRFKVPGTLWINPWKLPFSVPSGKTQTYQFSLQGEIGQAQEYTLESVDTQLNRRTEQVFLRDKQPLRLEHYRRNNGYLFSFGVGEGYVIEVLAEDQQGDEIRQSRGFAFRPAVRAKKPLRIDGQLDDWTDAVPLFIHPEGRLSGLTFFAKDYGRAMQWTGLDDFSAAWQMMWDESFLYLAVKTFDDVFIPQYNLGSFWNGDTISFQIDPLPDLTDASVIPNQRDLRRIHTFDVGLSQEGPKCRRKYPTYEKQAGMVEAIKVGIRQVQDGVIYELAIPWTELTPLRPEISGWMGFSLVFYDDDGFGRETHINWFGGSGGNGLAREPRLMGDVHFVQ